MSSWAVPGTFIFLKCLAPLSRLVRGTFPHVLMGSAWHLYYPLLKNPTAVSAYTRATKANVSFSTYSPAI